jgi:hypothetical protein
MLMIRIIIAIHMINALWRLVLTTLFATSLLLVLAIIWDVPAMIGYTLPGDFAKLPATLLTILALITGIWGTWSRGHRKDTIVKSGKISEPVSAPASEKV